MCSERPVVDHTEACTRKTNRRHRDVCANGKHYTHRIQATLVYQTDKQLPLFVIDAALIIVDIVTVVGGSCLRENRLGYPRAMYEI